jgi:hypothetical protein
MTVRHRLQRLEHLAQGWRDEKQQRWLRSLSDEELESLITELRAKTTDEEWLRMEQAVIDGPDAVEAYINSDN